MPASVRAFPQDARGPAVIVFISDPETKVRTVPEVLAQAYDLTAAELRSAEQLVQGETLVHAAERLGASHNTARTHLQKIYQKTTSHQADLVRCCSQELSSTADLIHLADENGAGTRHTRDDEPFKTIGGIRR
jgi:DNA-binding CsgD family transcriptional regulator